MGIIIDLIIILFILLSVYLGYRKGLVALGIHLIAFVLALVIGLILYRPIGDLVINTTSIDENMQNSIEVKLEEIINNEENNDLESSLIGNVEQDAISEAARSLSINIIYGVTIIVLFIILRIALVFVSAIASKVAELPLLKQVNKTGGVIYGLIRGLLVINVIILILNLIITFEPQGALNEAINSTYLAKIMMNYNVFNLFF